MTRVTKEWRIKVGETADGGAEERVIGYEVEDDFGGGNKTTRFKMHVDVLNPQLFALVRSLPGGKSAFVYAKRCDLPRRLQDKSAPAPPAEEVAEANGQTEG